MSSTINIKIEYVLQTKLGPEWDWMDECGGKFESLDDAVNEYKYALSLIGNSKRQHRIIQRKNVVSVVESVLKVK